MTDKVKKYGKTEEDIHTEKMIECRQIVKTIIDYGVTEGQKRQIIKLLSMELESVPIMKQISEILKKENTSNKKSLIYID